ncbi:MAG: hypothetical protein DRI57_22410 [Deltaproteobacteria bacterium]|nr:MAG: hypothetical protein DRI57_22410 [Deltaproteobacteria bacterium]
MLRELSKKKLGNKMNIYVSLIIVGSVAVALSAYLPLQAPDKYASLVLIILSTVLSLLLTYIITKRWMEKKFDDKIHVLKEKYEKKIHGLKKEHDTATLEKTIRDGTQTLIKNALDYFKLENIKNEMGDSAAIQNLQLDKYGQIIELLADFSLILPDITENRAIVQKEIVHQISVYQIDEKPFSMFLQRIMDKYIVTVNKKIREKISENTMGFMKTCPRCAERVMLKANVCKHCRHDFNTLPIGPPKAASPTDYVEKGKKLYDAGNYQEAIDAFSNAIKLKSDYAIAYYNRGIVHYRLDDNEQAEKNLREADALGYKKAEKLLKKKRAGTVKGLRVKMK